MTQHTVIHIVDDDKSFRSAVSRVLIARGYQTVAHASAEEYLSCRTEGRGCLLLDVRMQGLSGLQLQQELVARSHGLPIVFLTGHGDIQMSVRAIKAGAEDFLQKPIPTIQLLTAIEAALKRYDEEEQRQNKVGEFRRRLDSLTPREVEVFKAVLSGKRNKAIAGDLGTAERTIKAHRHQIMIKMKVSSLAELLSAAHHLGEGGQVSTR
jgi:FixJ family two-component response regulator